MHAIFSGFEDIWIQEHTLQQLSMQIQNDTHFLSCEIIRLNMLLQKLVIVSDLISIFLYCMKNGEMNQELSMRMLSVSNKKIYRL